jgi:hypothetical protein
MVLTFIPSVVALPLFVWLASSGLLLGSLIALSALLVSLLLSLLTG